MKTTVKLLSSFLLLSAFAANAVESVPGIRGNGAKIKGDEAYLYDKQLKKFDFKKGISVSFWVKGAKWSHQAGIITGIGETNISKRYDSSNGSFYFNTQINRKNAALLWAPECFSAPLNKWVHIALSYDTATRVTTAYFNGKKCALWNVGKEYPNRGNYELKETPSKALPFCIGRGNAGNFDGVIDEVFIYNRPLNAEEMAQVHAGKTLPGLQAAYLFDDPADLGKDSSPAKRHLTKQTGILAVKLPAIGYKVKTPVIISDKNLTVWSRSAIDKTFKYDTVISTGKATAPAAELAKNEYESFQLVFTPSKGLKNVKVTLSDFTFSKNRLVTTLHKVDYVNVVKTSGLSVTKAGGVMGEAATMFERIINHGPGEYPDPLPEAKALKEMVPGQSYAFWVTVKSSPSTPAGIYTAKATVTADGSYSLEVPLQVLVRNFALPEKFSSHNTAIMSYHYAENNRSAFLNMASEHHVTLCPFAPDPVVTFDAKGNMKIDTADFDRETALAINKYRANTIYFPGWGFYKLPRDFNTRQVWNGIQICKTPGQLTEEFKTRFGAYLEYMTAHLKKKGWLQYTRISMVDEPHTAADYALCQDFAKLIRKHAPGVKTLVTKWPLKPLLGSSDIWCLGLLIPEDMKAAIARGENFEWYPNWHFVIDRPLMDSRMLGFMMYKFNIKGILYFNICHGWNNPELVRKNPSFTYSNGRVINGLGQIIYPPEAKKGKPVTSLRFVMCRDAYEDYEYFLLAEKLIAKCKDPARAAAARKLLKEAGDAIVPAYEAYSDRVQWKKTRWETEGSKLLLWRQKIADLIEDLQK